MLPPRPGETIVTIVRDGKLIDIAVRIGQS